MLTDPFFAMLPGKLMSDRRIRDGGWGELDQARGCENTRLKRRSGSHLQRAGSQVGVRHALSPFRDSTLTQSTTPATPTGSLGCIGPRVMQHRGLLGYLENSGSGCRPLSEQSGPFFERAQCLGRSGGYVLDGQFDVAMTESAELCFDVQIP